MVHGADGAGQVTLIGPRRRRADPRHPVRSVGEPEERQAITPTTVEKEVLAHAARQLDGLDQWHAEDRRVEVDGPCHVAAHQGQVVDALEFESAIGHVSSPPPQLVLSGTECPNTKASGPQAPRQSRGRPRPYDT